MHIRNLRLKRHKVYYIQMHIYIYIYIYNYNSVQFGLVVIARVIFHVC